MKGLKVLLAVLTVYILSGLIVMGDRAVPEFPKLYINLNRFSYNPNGDVFAVIANFFIFIGNIIFAVIDIILYVAGIIMWIVNIITMSATFSWIPYPYNLFIAIPVNLLLIFGFITTIIDVGKGWI